MGFNVLTRYLSYVKPSLIRTPTQTFNSLSALQTQLNSQSNHGGAIYALADGVTYTGTLITVDATNFTLYTNPNNPATIDASGQNFGISLRMTSPGVSANINVLNLKITGSNFHGIFLGQDNSSFYTPRDVYIAGNEIYDVARSGDGGGIVARSGFDGGLITLECNEIRDVGNEGIYIGQGNSTGVDDYTNNVHIIGNYIHDIPAEAIDLKRDSRSILIQYNRIDRITVPSQGAITVLLRDRPTVGQYDADVRILNNCISNVTQSAFDGNFITIGNGSVDIEENIMFNSVSHGVDIYQHADGSDVNVRLNNNIIWGYNGLPIRENVATGGQAAAGNFEVTRNTNIVQSNPVGSECQEPASAFVGPLTTCEGFAPA